MITNNHLFKRLIIGWIVIFLSSTLMLSQTDSLTLFESLYGEQMIEMHIKTNLRQIIKHKSKKEKHKGVLTYTDANGVPQEWDIKIKARGNNRNEICFLPPLKLDFKKEELRKNGIQGRYDKFKLVVHCNNGDNYDNYVLREYLTYKLYNELTENSFRVQLVKLMLEDVEAKQKPIETYAFLIEDVDELAERLGGRVVTNKLFNPKKIHPASYDLMSVFQFMIGNLDWHILSHHNIKLVTNNTLQAVVAIPYDFDYAALVGTPYATPHTKLPVEDIRERYYLGLCRGMGVYEPTFQLFQNKKERLLAICQEMSLLSEKAKRPFLKYLEGFFEILENPKSSKKLIVNHCDRHIKVNLK